VSLPPEVRRVHASGCSVVALDRLKKARGEWKKFQERPVAEDELRTMAAPAPDRLGGRHRAGE